MDRIERAKAACHGLQNGKQREAHLLKGIDEDISNQSRAIREETKKADKAARKAKRQKTEPQTAQQGGGVVHQGGAGGHLEVAVLRAAAVGLPEHGDRVRESQAHKRSAAYPSTATSSRSGTSGTGSSVERSRIRRRHGRL